MLVYSGQISVDGYLVDDAGSFAWAMPTPEIHHFINGLERDTEVQLLGRRMYEVMRYWDDHERGGDGPLDPAMDEWADLWQGVDKVVYSTTLDEVGPRARIERAFEPSAVARVIEGRAASIGGAELAAHALSADLVDAVWSIRYPVVVGGGTPWLPAGLHAQLDLTDQRRFEGGAVYERYTLGAAA